MTMLFTIANSEFKRLFFSPLAWSILAILQFILALMFLVLVQDFVTLIQPQSSAIDNPPGVTDAIVASLYLWAGIIMLAVMPLLTMRSIAEERNQQTFDLLRSAPISMTDIVLGKFIALLLFILIMVGLLTLMPLSLTLGTTLDWGKLAAALLGLILLLSSFAAAGLFISSLTNQPIIAAISTFGFLLFLVVLYISGKSQTTESEIFVQLSHFGHFLPFLEGIFQSSDLVYYLLFIIGFLILTIRKLDNERLQR